MDDKILEGTTTVGITCKDGVVFASERRASMGNLVAHKVDEISVKAAASLTANILRSGPMYVQTLLGGMDGDKPSLYSLDPAGGMIKDTYISTGSGSIVAYGVLEDRFRDDLTTDEGIEIAIRAIRAAAERDTYSGNGYLVAKVDKNGFEMLDNEKINEILGKI